MFPVFRHLGAGRLSQAVGAVERGDGTPKDKGLVRVVIGIAVVFLALVAAGLLLA